MADQKVLGILLKAQADISKAVSDVKGGFSDIEKKAKETSEKMASEWKSSVESIRNQSAIAFAAVGAAIGYTVKESMEASGAIRRAQIAVEMAGESWLAYKDNLMAVAESQKALTRFDEDEAISTYARLTQATGNAADALKYLTLTQDLQAAFALDADTAARMLAQAIEGEAGRMGMLIPEIRKVNEVLGENASASDKAAYFIDVLQRRVGGFAEKDAKSFSGSLAQAKNELNDAAKAVGAVFIPMLQEMAVKIKGVGKDLQDYTKEHPELIKYLGITAVSVTGVVAALSSVALIIPKVIEGVALLKTALIALSASPVVLTITGIVAGLGLTYGILKQIGDAGTATKKTSASLQELSAELGVSVNYLQNQRNAISGADAWNSRYEEQWQKTIATLRAAKNPTIEEQQVITTLGAEAKKTAGDIKFFQETYKAAMESGMGASAAAALARTIPSIAPIDIEATISPEFGPEYDPMAMAKQRAEDMKKIEIDKQSFLESARQAGMNSAIAQEIALTSATKEQADKKLDIWRSTYDTMNQMLSPFVSAYNTAIMSIADTSMTGSQRVKVIFSSLFSSVLSQVGSFTSKWLFSAIAREAADKAVVATSIAGQAAITSANITTSATIGSVVIPMLLAEEVTVDSLTASYYALAAAKAIATGGLGFFGGLLSTIGFASGGVVPQYLASGGFPFKPKGTDVIPAMLTPGEFVVRKSVAQRHLPELTSLNNGTARTTSNRSDAALLPAYSPSQTNHITINAGNMTDESKDSFIRQLEDRLARAWERISDQRKLRPGFAS
jgi:ABC-type transporter Mla subunit MlaD